MASDVQISKEADGRHLEIKSPNGTWWRIAVDNEGNISAVEV